MGILLLLGVTVALLGEIPDEVASPAIMAPWCTDIRASAAVFSSVSSTSTPAFILTGSNKLVVLKYN